MINPSRTAAAKKLKDLLRHLVETLGQLIDRTAVNNGTWSAAD